MTEKIFHHQGVITRAECPDPGAAKLWLTNRRPEEWRGFVLWARASEPAFISGLFIRSKNVASVEVPSASLLRRADLADVGREGVDHPPGVWFSEDCHKITIHSDKYDRSLAILDFGRDTRTFTSFGEADEPDAFDRFNPKPRDRFG